LKGHNSRIEKVVNSELDCIIPYLSTIIIYPLNETSIPVFFNTSKTSSDDIEEVTFTVFVPTSVTTSLTLSTKSLKYSTVIKKLTLSIKR
jgi:hypothetical protein